MGERESRQLTAMYQRRFSSDQRASKERIWQVLCTSFFARYVDANATVLDVGAGHCEFINHIACAHRIAVDANPELPNFAAKGVVTHVAKADKLGFLENSSIDFAFASNFLEHLPDKGAVDAVVAEVFRVLRSGGLFCVMGPNIRYVQAAYWDYYDHRVPLTERSTVELLETSGFVTAECYARFMPYTVRSWLPTHQALVRLYLGLAPLSFQLFGKQFLVIARKPRFRKTGSP